MKSKKLSTVDVDRVVLAGSKLTVEPEARPDDLHLF